MSGSARLVVATFVLLALGTGTAVASNPSLKPMVLGLHDLPAGFVQNYSQAVSKAQVVKQQGYANPGYVSGWQAQFAKTGFGSVIVISTASRYGTSGEARASLLDSFKRARKLTGMKELPLGEKLGKDARGFSYDGKVSGLPAKTYVVTWRYRNFKGAVILIKLAILAAPVEQAKALALKQYARMVRLAVK